MASAMVSGLHRPGPTQRYSAADLSRKTLPTPSPSCRAFGPWRPSRASRRGSNDGSRVIRVGLSWGRTLEPRELGLRGFRTLLPPSTGDPNRAQLVDRPRPDRTRPLASDTGPRQPRRPDKRNRVNKPRGHGHGA